MNKVKIVIILCICVATVSSQVTSTYAADGSQSVTVSYTPSEIATFKMGILIVGEGSIFDGTQEIVGITTVFELKYDDKKTFNINPAKGSQLKSIVYDEIDITDQLKNGGITVTQKDYDTKLVITFEEEPSSDKPTKPDNGNTDSEEKGEASKPNKNTPKTGVITNEEIWIMLGTLSGIFLLLLWKRKKEEEESEEELHR